MMAPSSALRSATHFSVSFHVFSAATVESTLKANETLENQLNARLRSD